MVKERRRERERGGKREEEREEHKFCVMGLVISEIYLGIVFPSVLFYFPVHFSLALYIFTYLFKLFEVVFHICLYDLFRYLLSVY